MKKYLFILLILSSAPAVADLSKWVDENGKVHYSDQPPPANVKAKTLRSTSDTPLPLASASGVAASSAPPAVKTIAEREAELKKAQKAKKEAADKAAQEQARKDIENANCAAAQQSLRALQDGMRMVEIDAKGERSYISDEQRQQRIAKTQQDISTLCK